MKNKLYQKTIAVYNEMGRDYLKKITGLTPPEIYDFMKLLPKGGKVLDAGCAGGRDSQVFVKHSFKVVGVDLSEVLLKEAVKNVPEARFVKMDVKHLKFPTRSFDGIWANAILVHVMKKDMSKTLKGFYRVLKPNGKMHIRVKRGKGKLNVNDFLPDGKHLPDGKYRLFTYFTKEEIKKFVWKAGFKIMPIEMIPDESKRKGVKWIKIWAEK